MKQVLRLGLASALIVGVFAIAGQAQATRTWVSGVGDDVNPCSRTAPCKTFAGAFSKTAEDGLINCLDPGAYGTLTITKSITVDCTGVFGGSLATLGTNGFIINITSSTDARKAVVLKGIDISGAASGNFGIRILAANSVTIDNVTIDGFASHGISVESPAGPKIFINRSTIRNNGGHGINVYTIGAPSLQIADSSITNNTQNGLNLAFLPKGSIRDSTISGNNTGLLVYNSDFSVMNCIFNDNSVAIQTYTGGNARISGNTISNNSTGLLNTGGGSIISGGNNAIQGNGTNGSPNQTITLQ